jgi:hypothetical protein
MKTLFIISILSLLLTNTFAKKSQLVSPSSNQQKSISFYLNQIKEELKKIENGNLELKENIEALKKDTKGILKQKKSNYGQTLYKSRKVQTQRKRSVKKRSTKKRTIQKRTIQKRSSKKRVLKKRVYKSKKSLKSVKKRGLKLDFVDSITLTLEKGMTAKYLAQKFYGNPSYAKYIRRTNRSFRVGDTIRIPGLK